MKQYNQLSNIELSKIYNDILIGGYQYQKFELDQVYTKFKYYLENKDRHRMIIYWRILEKCRGLHQYPLYKYQNDVDILKKNIKKTKEF